MPLVLKCINISIKCLVRENKTLILTSRDGAVVACWAHNPEVGGAIPSPATTRSIKIRSSRTGSTVRWLATSEGTLILKISPTEPCNASFKENK